MGRIYTSAIFGISRATNKMIGRLRQVQIADKYRFYFNTSCQLSDNYLSNDVSEIDNFISFLRVLYDVSCSW